MDPSNALLHVRSRRTALAEDRISDKPLLLTLLCIRVPAL